jgi:putative endonuclease
MFYTYVLTSKQGGNFYIGYTNNLEKRLKEHQKGKVRSTAGRIPLKLIYYEACLNEKDALKREKYFKSGFGRRFLKNRLESFLTSEY